MLEFDQVHKQFIGAWHAGRQLTEERDSGIDHMAASVVRHY